MESGLDDRRTIRAHDSSDIRKRVGTIESALSVAAEICATFFRSSRCLFDSVPLMLPPLVSPLLLHYHMKRFA